MKTPKRSRNAAGLSLIEVVIGMVILSAVILMTYSVLFSVTGTASKGTLNSNLDDRGKNLVSYLKNQFYDARFRHTQNAGLYKLGIHDDATQIHFQVALRQNAGGAVEFGYVGGRLDFIDKIDPVSGKPVIDPKTGNPYKVGDYTPWIDFSCVIRFEAEVVYYEANSASPVVTMPGTADVSGPQEWRPNPYANGAKLAKGDVLPVQLLNRDINGDGDKTDVFVKGKIWKYLMDAANKVKDEGLERISDDVILCVRADGKFMGEVDGATPAGQPAGKDWLFRFLISEPATPTTYGNTDINGMASQDFPTPQAVAVAVSAWHGVEDDSGKRFFLRKTWDRIPFRLSNN